MKKSLLLSVMTILTIVLVVVGCARSTAPEVKTDEPVIQTEAFKLKMNMTTPETAKSSQFVAEMTERVRERTNGGLDITVYFSSTLVDTADIIKALETGIIDMSNYTYGANPGAHHLNLMSWLEFLWPSSEVAQEIWPLFFEKWQAEFQRDLRNVKQLSIRFYASGDWLNTTNKPVTVPSDLRGMKIIARGEILTKGIASMGGAVLDVPTTEVYSALERGLADGNTWPPNVIRTFRTGELYKYHTVFTPVEMKNANMVYLMNMEVWDSLPPEYQQTLLEEIERMNIAHTDWEKTDSKMLMDEQIARGATFINPTIEQLKEWEALFKPLHEIYLESTEKAGFPKVREIYADLQRILDVYRETGRIEIY